MANEDPLVVAARDARDFLRSFDTSTGGCMCGSPVESHGIGDGHSPVDEGDYHAGHIIEALNEALRERNVS